MLGEQDRVRVDVERLVLAPLRHAEPATGVHLADLVPGVHDAPGHLGHTLDRDLEARQPVGQEPVADVAMQGVDRERVLGGESECIVELFGQDAELRRLRLRVERLTLRRGQAAPRGAGARIHADPDRGARRPPPPPVELREQVEVHVDPRLEQRVDVGGRQVRAREADLVRRPTVLESVSNLARRARVDPDRTQTADEREDLGIALRLEREAELEGGAHAFERVDQPTCLLPDPGEVVHVHGGRVLPSDGLGVAPGHEQPPVPNLEPRPRPPRCVHVEGRC